MSVVSLGMRIGKRVLIGMRRFIAAWSAKIRGLSVASDAVLDIEGTFTFGKSSSVGKGAVLVVPTSGRLSFGTGCYIGRYVEIGPGGIIAIGNRTSLQDRCVILGDVSIGEGCLFAYNVYISSGRHYFDLHPSWFIKDQDEFVADNKELREIHSRPVAIEDDCWIGVNCVVMPGVTIGKGAVVGANSVITKDVPPYTVVAGSPARVIKERLVFMPPRSIDYDQPDDRPYFYSGFELSKSSIEKNLSFGGIVAGKSFVICLDASSGESIRLIARSATPEGCSISFGGKEIKLSWQFEEIVFEIDENTRKTNRFQMWTDSRLVIKKAWIV